VIVFLVSLLRVGAVFLVASAAGWTIAGRLFPGGERHRRERLGWSVAIGCGIVIAFVPLSLAVGAQPGWIAFLLLAALPVAASRLLAPLTPPSSPRGGRAEVQGGDVDRPTGDSRPPLPAGADHQRQTLGSRQRRPDGPAVLGWGEGRSGALLKFLIVAGVVLYALRALTEPMWANDFIAIWGLKGKTIFGAVGYPERLTRLGFAHPEYPLGLPLLYAGISFLTGRWDDHAMALVFPLFQVGTLLVLFGWLRRRGVSAMAAGLAAAIVSWFEPLYSGFLTGMAEVPLAFGALLFGTALADALDEADAGALRRLAFAAALFATLKNEGLFLAAEGALLALFVGKGRRWKVALAALGPALVIRLLHLPWRSRVPLEDFDWSLFSIDRVWESFGAAMLVPSWAAWVGLVLVFILIMLGDRAPAGNRLLLLVACAAAAYLVIPAFAVRGPAWLIETTLPRTTAALVPLAAAAVSVRFAKPPG
jgi:hypothetical protein